LCASPSAELDGHPEPHYQPEAESQDRKYQVEQVICSFPEHDNLLAAVFAEPAFLLFCHFDPRTWFDCLTLSVR